MLTATHQRRWLLTALDDWLAGGGPGKFCKRLVRAAIVRVYPQTPCKSKGSEIQYDRLSTPAF